MKSLVRAVAASLIILSAFSHAYAQRNLVTSAQKSNLQNFSAQLSASFKSGQQKALSMAALHNWPTRKVTTGGRVLVLQGVNKLGFPIFLRTSNTEAASATRTDAVQPGGELGLNLSGSSPVLQNKIAIWDGGTVLRTHREFNTKTITIPAGETGAIDHTTHVAGTMFAQGIYAPAKGMAFGLSTLRSFDFDNDVSEISNNAPELLISNHSYGDVAGWDQNEEGQWIWYGLPGDNEDYLFGFYDERAQAWDRIAFNAPYYLMVESAGNAHGYNGPSLGSTYYGYKSRTDQTIINKGPRPANISSNDAYDVITTTGNAKNILTVGAVNPINGGPNTAADVRIASFSSWGPTDDGRIKPDIVGMGVRLVSTAASGSDQYYISSGTSMSTPNVSGSLVLLQEYYSKLHNDSLMKAATLKGLVCHTAFDAGNEGPDYIYGWGMLDMRKAAQTITNNGTSSRIIEGSLVQGQSARYTIYATGNAPLAATISWTDPEGTPHEVGTLNDRTPQLVNDLDIRITGNGTVTAPWTLNPETPSAAATHGDNIRDNIEQVYINSALANGSYTVTVTHKGVLKNGSQDFSLILTGGRVATEETTSPREGLTAFPVPAKDYLNVYFSVEEAGELDLQLVDMTGRIVYRSKESAQKGAFSKAVNVAGLSSGTYVLRVITGQQAASKKVIIVKAD